MKRLCEMARFPALTLFGKCPTFKRLFSGRGIDQTVDVYGMNTAYMAQTLNFDPGSIEVAIYDMSLVHESLASPCLTRF